MLAFVKKTKQKQKWDKSRPILIWYGMHHFTFKYGTILYFKGRVATLTWTHALHLQSCSESLRQLYAVSFEKLPSNTAETKNKTERPSRQTAKIKARFNMHVYVCVCIIWLVIYFDQLYYYCILKCNSHCSSNINIIKEYHTTKLFIINLYSSVVQHLISDKIKMLFFFTKYRIHIKSKGNTEFREK